MKKMYRNERGLMMGVTNGVGLSLMKYHADLLIKSWRKCIEMREGWWWGSWCGGH